MMWRRGRDSNHGAEIQPTRTQLSRRWSGSREPSFRSVVRTERWRARADHGAQRQRRSGLRPPPSSKPAVRLGAGLLASGSPGLASLALPQVFATWAPRPRVTGDAVTP